MSHFFTVPIPVKLGGTPWPITIYEYIIASKRWLGNYFLPIQEDVYEYKI
jgi:hypothetical protein